MAHPKNQVDIEGREYDWLASDITGCVALFSTAGAGYAPRAFLEDTDAHYEAIQALLALPETTVAARAPQLSDEYVNTWKLVAERGLYAYDCNPNGGPYQLVAVPATPIRTDQLPPAIAHLVVMVRCDFPFGVRSVVDEMLP
jgi:hypothetical protein